MFSDPSSFCIRDQAHKLENYGAMSTGIYDIPQELDIDRETYLAGSYKFRMKEIEVYQVLKADDKK